MLFHYKGVVSVALLSDPPRYHIHKIIIGEKMQDNILNEIKKLVQDSIPQWLSIKDAVRISGLSESSIRRAISMGVLKANKVGGKWLIKSEWLNRYLTS